MQQLERAHSIALLTNEVLKAQVELSRCKTGRQTVITEKLKLKLNEELISYLHDYAPKKSFNLFDQIYK